MIFKHDHVLKIPGKENLKSPRLHPSVSDYSISFSIHLNHH